MAQSEPLMVVDPLAGASGRKKLKGGARHVHGQV